MSEPICRHGDVTCPCQDGDACHYEDSGDTKAWPCAHCVKHVEVLPIARPDALDH